MEKVLVSWSGGKDCALALHEILSNREYQVAGLLTTITGNNDRIDMHDVRFSMLERQAESSAFLWKRYLYRVIRPIPIMSPALRKP